MAIWSPRTASAAVFVALMLAVALAAPAGASAKTCGSFTHTYRYTVGATGGLKCSSALRIVKSFIKNHKAWAEHSVDGTTAGTYYTNRNYKGWRCGEGSGGGSCWRGKRYATYENH
jgi:hypothetical protein